MNAVIGDIKESLYSLSKILDYDHSDNIALAQESILEEQKSADKEHNHENIVAENENLKKDITILRKKLLEKERKIQKMQFIYGINE